MNTREIAYSIFSQLSDKQLEGFITMFGDFFTVTQDSSKKEAFEDLKTLIRPVPDLDYDKELEQYRNEKYKL